MAVICKAEITFAQTFFGAASEATGESGRAANSPLEEHYLNPASLAFSQGAKVGGAYGQVRNSTDSPQAEYPFIITDNDPDQYAAGGIAYLYRRQSFPDHVIIDQDWSLDVASKVVPTISIGMQARRLFRMNSGGPGFTKHNLTFGTLVLPKPWLGFAFVAYDMLNDDDNDTIPTIALATHVIVMDIMRIRADVTQPQKLNPGKNGTLNLGLELDGGSGFLFRAGGIWDAVAHNRYWTAGIGWEGPKLCVGYAFKSNVDVDGDQTQLFQAWLNF